MLFHKLTDQENDNWMVTSLKEKILGVIFDGHLTWKKHIQVIKK